MSEQQKEEEEEEEVKKNKKRKNQAPKNLVKSQSPPSSISLPFFPERALRPGGYLLQTQFPTLHPIP